MYWSIRSDVKNYGVETSKLETPFEKTVLLADVPTRLKALEPELQQRLINWGYAICDIALRKHFDPSLQEPGRFPYNSVGV